MGKLLLRESSDDVEVLHEQDEHGKNQLFIEGIFAQSEVVNKNKRVYGKSILENAVNDYINDYVNERRALGELNHPKERPFADPAMGAVLIKELHWQGNDVYGKALVLPTPQGAIVKGLLEGGFKLGVSTRGLGSVSESNGMNKVTEYMMTAIDCVDNPSGPNCFVNAVNESVEWVQVNGVWQPLIKESLNNDDTLQLFEDKFRSILKIMSKTTQTR